MMFELPCSGKESACNARDPGLISGSGRSPGEGNDNPLQYSCLENPTDPCGLQFMGHKESDTTEWLMLYDVYQANTVLKIKCLFIHLIFPQTLWGLSTILILNGEPEAQSDWVTFPRLHSQWEVESAFEPVVWPHRLLSCVFFWPLGCGTYRLDFF